MSMVARWSPKPKEHGFDSHMACHIKDRYMNLRRLMNKPEPPRVDRPYNIEWEMKNGTVVLSYTMSNNHIRNCIKMLDDKILNLTLKSQQDYKSRALDRAIDDAITEWKSVIIIFKKELQISIQLWRHL